MCNNNEESWKKNIGHKCGWFRIFLWFFRKVIGFLLWFLRIVAEEIFGLFCVIVDQCGMLRIFFRSQGVVVVCCGSL